MSLQDIIETASENRADISPSTIIPEVKEAVLETIHQLDSGKLRVVERLGAGEWKVNEWAKKAVLLSFRIQDNEVLNDGVNRYFDKVLTKSANQSGDELRATGFRAAPGAVARRGSFVARNVVLMPPYVNIGVYADEGVMVDTWVTVGSYAQIDKNVHLSGGIGIGGVLEPLQASPTIIEDNYFIGVRSEIVESVTVEKDSVISMGVFIGQSTKILNRIIGEIYQGRVLAGSAVVFGNMPSKDDSHSLYYAVIVKHVDVQIRAKTSANELLRGTRFRFPIMKETV